MLFELEWAALQHVGLPSIGLISRFPPVRRDLAIVVDQHVPAQALVDAMIDTRAPGVETVQVFDVYRGPSLPEGKKSVAFLVLEVLEKPTQGPTASRTTA